MSFTKKQCYIPMVMIGILLIVITLIFFFWTPSEKSITSGQQKTTSSSTHTFVDTFDTPFVIEEMSDMAESTNPHWWLNSGAYLFVQDGIAKTVQGELEQGSKWQKSYNDYNPESTDSGTHPQNIFRLIARERFLNAEQELSFQVTDLHFSDTEFRNESNGILLMHRYTSDNDFYYLGLRVDGEAVIKKKIDGNYYTLAVAVVFPIEGGYHRTERPNGLPMNTWMGLRSNVNDLPNGSVQLVLDIDRQGNGTWETILETTDTPWRFKAKVHRDNGFVGIRTDFMDVVFDDYSITEL